MVSTAKTIQMGRILLDLSQGALAEKMGVTPATVSQWENGHAEPRHATMRRFLILCEQGGIGFTAIGMPVLLKKDTVSQPEPEPAHV